MATEFIVRVHHSDITKEERDRRMKQIYKAAENVLKEKEKGERKNATTRFDRAKVWQINGDQKSYE